MRSFRIPPWVPCVVAAAGLHLLAFVAWDAQPHFGSRPAAASESDVVAWVRTPYVEEADFAPLSEPRNEAEAAAVRTRLLAALQERSSRLGWEGVYNTGVGFTGTSLFVTQDGFVETRWSCFGEESFWGSLTSESDSLLLRPAAAGELELRLFVMPWSGDTYLIEPRDMGDFLDQANSGFLLTPTSGPRFLHMRGAAGAEQGGAPPGYLALWTRLPHLVVRHVEDARGKQPRMVEFDLTKDACLQVPQLALYWDADSSGCIRAIESERHGSTLIAALVACESGSVGNVLVGATFTPLPRLR